MEHFKTRDELNSFLDSVREFALGLDPIAQKIDGDNRLPAREVIRMFREKGLWNCGFPKKYGGMGLSFSEYWRVLANVALTGRSIALLFHGHNTGNWRLIDVMGTTEQKERYLPRLSNGEMLISLCLTEREAGTGRDIKSYATKQGNKWCLNGEKYLISYSDLADEFCVIAYSNREKGEISVFMVKKGAAGFSRKRMGNSMGCRGSIHGTLEFKDVEIRAEDVLVRGGLETILDYLDISRTAIAAQCLGLARRCYELAVDYSKKRNTFGKSISERQAIQTMIANMAVSLYALESSIADTAKKIDLGKPVRREAASCKRLGIDTVREVTDNALLVHGGRGYFDEFPLEMLYRDGRAMWFEEGTPQIQNLAVAREALSQPKWWDTI
ncbi:acyl-CoA dehydrogenase family protein [Chloroflexota bacterium]